MKSSALQTVILLVITAAVAISSLSSSPDKVMPIPPDTTIPIPPEKIIEESSILSDPSMYLDGSEGYSKQYWLLNREATFSINPKVLRQFGSSVRVTAGNDPCGIQTILEVSAEGSPSVMLGTKVNSIYYDPAKPRFHVRSLGAVCLIGSDPRDFYGRVEVIINGTRPD